VAQTFFNLGNAYVFTKEFKNAFESYQQALVGDPSNIDFNFNLASTALEL
jgi:cytochrome c-type biogenesis protein CcmH/NrfG